MPREDDMAIKRALSSLGAQGPAPGGAPPMGGPPAGGPPAGGPPMGGPPGAVPPEGAQIIMCPHCGQEFPL